jgi:hypothetical protein
MTVAACWLCKVLASVNGLDQDTRTKGAYRKMELGRMSCRPNVYQEVGVLKSGQVR